MVRAHPPELAVIANSLRRVDATRAFEARRSGAIPGRSAEDRFTPRRQLLVVAPGSEPGKHRFDSCPRRCGQIWCWFPETHCE